MKDWDKRQFGEGLNQKQYEKIRDIVPFKGEHPDVMKKLQGIFADWLNDMDAPPEVQKALSEKA